MTAISSIIILDVSLDLFQVIEKMLNYLKSVYQHKEPVISPEPP